jgi:hypothetical protein
MKSILDPSFSYTNSAATDIRKTFARVRKELKIPEPKPSKVVIPIKQVKK